MYAPWALIIQLPRTPVIEWTAAAPVHCLSMSTHARQQETMTFFSHFPIAAVGDIARRVYFLRVYLSYLHCMLARLCHLVSQILQETRVESTALMLKYFHTSEVAITSTSSWTNNWDWDWWKGRSDYKNMCCLQAGEGGTSGCAMMVNRGPAALPTQQEVAVIS